MPIPKSVVDKYLARQIESRAWVKNLLPLEVEEYLSYIKPPIKIKSPLRIDQKAVLLLCLAHPETMVMTDLGWGKTALSLELLSYFYEHGFMQRGFIFCPTNEVAEGWVDEIKKWGFDIPYVRLSGSSHDKWEQLSKFDNGIVIGTYIGIAAMAAKLVPVLDDNNRPTEKRKRKIQTRAILSLIQDCDAIVLDQCFPGYTLIDTLSGKKPINTLKDGDTVISSDFSQRRITKVHRKQSSVFSRLYLSNGRIIDVTPDHPIFTEYGWACAGNTEGLLLYDSDSLQNLWNYIPTPETSTRQKPSVLQPQLLQYWPNNKSSANYNLRAMQKTIFRTPGTRKSILQSILLEEIRCFEDRPEQQNAKNVHWETELEQGPSSPGRCADKTQRSPFEKWPHLQISWGQRDRYVFTAAAFADRIKPAMEAGVCHFIKASAARLSNMLQSGFWQSQADDSNRGGWQLPPQFITESGRQEKDQKAPRIRVDRVENIKRDRPENVYTLTVEGCPHFFAEGILVHNSTKTGNNASLSYEVCKEFSQEAQLRFALAGRAFGRDPFILWSQFFLTDKGRALGTSPGMFREAFWRRVQNPWGTSWTIRKRREPELAKFVAASSIRYSIEECVDLPPKVYVRKECEFPPENWTYYDRIREELLSAKGNYQEIKNNFLRMRQISSGFIGFKDDETGEKAQIEFEENPKLDLLMQLIDEVPDDKKMVIFHEYTWSGSRICQELTKAKLKFGWLWGGTKDWTKIKDAFNQDPDFRIIVANHRKASMGLNLQSANYIFYYESPVSGIDRYESEGRIYRTGQKYKSMIYDLLLKDSIDSRILDFHSEAGSLFKALVEDPSKYFGKKQ